MDHEFKSGIQDVLRCDLCEIPAPSMHCDICHIHLCKVCVGEHLSDESKEHKVVAFKKRGFAIPCPKHSTKICVLHCQPCDYSVCTTCASSEEHRGHEFCEIFENIVTKKEAINRDLDELETVVYPTYNEIALSIFNQKGDMKIHSQNLKTAFNKYGEEMHKEIDDIVSILKTDQDEMDTKHLAVLNKQEEEVARTIYEIRQGIAHLKELQISKNASLVSTYKSRNAEFRSLPAKLTVSLSSFTPQVDKQLFHQQFCCLPASSIKIDEYGYKMKSHPSNLSFITELNTEYTRSNPLRRILCLNDENIWTCGHDEILRLYNLKGELVKSIETISGKDPRDIAVTNDGNLFYTDYSNKTVNIVKKKQIEVVIKLRDWKPRSLCFTSSGDLLVIMDSDDEKQTRVVRYFDFKEKQRIQYNHNGQRLFSSSFIKYISENRNLDICVSDYGSSSVVVVNHAGKLRFTYKGLQAMKIFNPRGITTDSQSRILVADRVNNCIHMIDKNGHFLHLITNFDLDTPCGLCVDSKDNIFVAENGSGKVKKIKNIV